MPTTPSRSSQIGLNALNFCVAAVQTGFGPFVSVWLTRQGWSQTDIGLALGIGTGVALLGQLPAGVIVDAAHHKRGLTAVALAVLAASALLLAVPAVKGVVFAAEILHALASCLIVPAIASITLGLCGHAAFSQRLGVNARYSGLGNAAGAATMGAMAWFLSERMVFGLAALLVMPSLIALFAIRHTDRLPSEGEHPALLPPRERPHRPWQIFGEPALHLFAVCVVLFQLANAAMLPLALNGLAQRTGSAGPVVSASIMLASLIVALLSPWFGRLAQRWGRRPLLLLGFAALPARALLFATEPGALGLITIQTLDGISGTVFGLMLPLIAADLTRRTGFLNLAMGSLGLAAGAGAMISTIAAGWITDRFGPEVAFLGLAAIGAAGLVLIAGWMPETRPETGPKPGPDTGHGLAFPPPSLPDAART